MKHYTGVHVWLICLSLRLLCHSRPLIMIVRDLWLFLGLLTLQKDLMPKWPDFRKFDELLVPSCTLYTTSPYFLIFFYASFIFMKPVAVLHTSTHLPAMLYLCFNHSHYFVNHHYQAFESLCVHVHVSMSKHSLKIKLLVWFLIATLLKPTSLFMHVLVGIWCLRFLLFNFRVMV